MYDISELQIHNIIKFDVVYRNICLLIQQSLPVMVYGKEPVTVTYRGGTNTDHAPPIDHYTMVSCIRSRL